MSPDVADLETRIRGFLGDVLGVDMTEVRSDTSILRSGLIDSAGLVRLAAFLEVEAGIEIPDRDVTAKHFDSLAAIDAYVREQTQASG